MTYKRLIYIIILLGFVGCRSLNPSIMLKTPKNYNYNTLPDTTSLEYKISPNDYLEFRLFSNDGFQLIDLITNSQNNLLQRSSIEYIVEHDGYVNFPIVNRIKLSGLTLREAEFKLEEIYSAYYNKPFVLLKVSNRRVIIFPGSGGKASVIHLENENIKLLEALALAGGITNSGKAHKIKLIRGTLNNPEIYLIDLSTIDGINQADIVLQANDIIYVEPVFNFTREVLSEITPIVSLITSALIIWRAFELFK